LGRDERVLAWAATADPARVVVVTNLGLWLPGAPGQPPGPAERLGWAEIHKVVWSERELVITPALASASVNGFAVMVDQPRVRLVLPEPGDVPHQVRGRVTRSVAYTVHHPLPGGGGVRVVGRRVPGLDGLRWTVRYDDGADVDDPVVREVTSEFVAQARASVIS
jgi:hypothetical protein